jgi:nicotinamide mononucleotide (NMN) deamidase PncC
MSDRARTLHDSPWQGVFYLTGGGTSILTELLGTSGASRTLLDARIPYSNAALAELLGGPPEQACSEATARAMAMRAFQQARQLGSTQPFGLGCTASLATDRVKKGQHRAHTAVQTASATFVARWTFSDTRAVEETTLSELLWAKLAHVLELDRKLAGSVDATAIQQTAGKPAWQALILGDSRAHPTADHDGKLLMPGAFNPFHEGHRIMLGIAEELTGLDGAYELSVANVDKPFLDYREIEARLTQFDRPVWLTQLATFLEKARHFQGAHFVVGVDTLIRIADPRYYGNDRVRDEALLELHEYGARFVVFGRELEGGFKILGDVASQLPDTLVADSIEVKAERFQNPISSTALRTSVD